MSFAGYEYAGAVGRCAADQGMDVPARVRDRSMGMGLRRRVDADDDNGARVWM